MRFHVSLLFLFILLFTLPSLASAASNTDPYLDMLLAFVQDPQSAYPLPESRSTTFGAGEFQKYKNDEIELSDYNAMAQFDVARGSIILCGAPGSARNVRYWRRLNEDTILYTSYVIFQHFETILQQTQNQFMVVLSMNNRRFIITKQADAERMSSVVEQRISPKEATTERK